MLNSGTRFNDSLVSGVAGAVALTAVHQAARAVTDSAPRMDVVGMRALARGADAAGRHTPATHRGLYGATLAGDLICNSAYYSLATTYTRGTLMGLAAGIGALVLPERLGLGTPPKSELLSNQVMTVAWYVVGGLAAACTSIWLANRRAEATREFVGGY
ncbi:MAG: hypothetical protein H0W08_22165 [Acidobacteria bacterium]|nr:hypothetical protein [Acidobacteriota bacterium]